MEPLEQKLAELQVQLKSYVDKAAEEKTQFGTMLSETKTALEGLQKQYDAIDVKLAERHAQSAPPETLEEMLKKDESVCRLMKDRRGMAVFSMKGAQVRNILERKTTITSTAVGLTTTGVLQIDRIPGITPEARQDLKVRDLLTARPTTMQVVDFVKVNAPMAIASPQTEASDKAQNAVTFTSVSEKVRTLATWIPATKQVLDDFSELAGFINSTMPYYVNLEEELQLLSGDGTGENLHGLIPQATAFSTGLLSAAAGWNKIDIVGRAIQQITAAKELQPTFAVVHPTDWWGMRLAEGHAGTLHPW
jgi:HK97 family phage major capsid protein